MSAFGYLVVFLQQYIVPFIFAIALIFLVYGIIQYFILGPSEEPNRDAGRVSFIKAFVWLLLGMALYGLVSLFVWLGSMSIDFTATGDNNPRLQNVPNTPRTNN